MSFGAFYLDVVFRYSLFVVNNFVHNWHFDTSVASSPVYFYGENDIFLCGVVRENAVSGMVFVKIGE